MDLEQGVMSFGSPGRLAAWKARPWRFKLQHRCNVLTAFLKGEVTWQSCRFGLESPEAVVFLAHKKPLKTMICVCPEASADLDRMNAQDDATPASA